MKIIHKALLEVARESLEIDLDKSKIPLKRAFSSQIKLDSMVFVIVINEAFLRKFALNFLDEEKPKTDVLNDIAKEITNLIIGRAKVLYEANGEILKLGIPEFLGKTSIGAFNKAIHYKHNKMRCSIYEVS